MLLCRILEHISLDTAPRATQPSYPSCPAGCLEIAIYLDAAVEMTCTRHSTTQDTECTRIPKYFLRAPPQESVRTDYGDGVWSPQSVIPRASRSLSVSFSIGAILLRSIHHLIYCPLLYLGLHRPIFCHIRHVPQRHCSLCPRREL